MPIATARGRHTPIGWRVDDLPSPSFLGRRVVEGSLAEIARYVDWTFFFTAWDLAGTFPAILDHPERGKAARELYEAGTALLDRIVRDGSLVARGVYGFWPAASEGDDVVLFTDETRSREHARFPMLRRQEEREGGEARRKADLGKKSGGADDFRLRGLAGGVHGGE